MQYIIVIVIYYTCYIYIFVTYMLYISICYIYICYILFTRRPMDIDGMSYIHGMAYEYLEV